MILSATSAMRGRNHADRWPGGLIKTMNGAQRLSFLCSSRNDIGSVDPEALKILARRANTHLAESAPSPFQAERTQGRA